MKGNIISVKNKMAAQVQLIKNNNNDSHKQQLRQKEDKTTFSEIPLKRQIVNFTQLIKLCFTAGYSYFS